MEAVIGEFSKMIDEELSGIESYNTLLGKLYSGSAVCSTPEHVNAVETIKRILQDEHAHVSALMQARCAMSGVAHGR